MSHVIMKFLSTYKYLWIFLLVLLTINVHANDISPLTKVEITSTNISTGFAKLWDVITLNVWSNDNINIVYSLIRGEQWPIISWNPTERKLIYTVHSWSIEGLVSFSFSHLVWNTLYSFNYPLTHNTSNNSSIIIDKTPPLFSSITLSGNNKYFSSLATIGNTIRVDFSVNELLWWTPIVTIANQTANVISWANWNNRVALYTVNSGSQNGLVNIKIDIKDRAWNINSISKPTNDSVIIIDTTPPVIQLKQWLSWWYTSESPSIKFEANEIGTIIYSGSCTSNQSTSTPWINTIIFNPLNQITTNNCNISLQDPAWNISNSIIISPFQIDTIPPVLSLSWQTIISIPLGTTYKDPSVICVDNSNIDCIITKSWSVNTQIVWTYTILYTAQDKAGNTSMLTRNINVLPIQNNQQTTNNNTPIINTNTWATWWVFNPQILSNYVVDPSSVCTWAYTNLTIQFSYTSQGISTIRYICNDNNWVVSTTNATINSWSSSTPQNNYNIVKFNNDNIYNNSIKDWYCYTRPANISLIDSSMNTTSEEFKSALTFLYSYSMTSFRSIDEFWIHRNLSRQEAAKILSNFAINVLCRKPDFNLEIWYTDIENADNTLKPYIKLAYQLGLMKWNGQWTWEFRPYDIITKAELNAVIIRMILKSYLDENNTLWYSNYNSVSSSLNIITQWAWLEHISRHDAALMMFRAYKNHDYSLQNLGYESYVLESRNQFIQ